jgi:DNA adenine methylase
MIISLNDHPDMRDVFSGLRIETTELKYTVGGQKGTGSKSRELVILNW